MYVVESILEQSSARLLTSFGLGTETLSSAVEVLFVGFAVDEGILEEVFDDDRFGLLPSELVRCTHLQLSFWSDNVYLEEVSAAIFPSIPPPIPARMTTRNRAKPSQKVVFRKPHVFPWFFRCVEMGWTLGIVSFFVCNLLGNGYVGATSRSLGVTSGSSAPNATSRPVWVRCP